MKNTTTHLLLIEDNPGDARLMSEYLLDDEITHYEIQQFGRLADGLKHLAEQTPDIILVDLDLPDSQGMGTFKNLHTAAPQVPIVILTGLKDMQKAALAVQAGAQDYLTKDEVTSSLLRRSLRYAIERKQALETLRQNEERFRLMFENAPVGYQSLDAKGCFLEVNDSWLNMLGYTRDEVIGRWFGDFLHPDQVELFQERFPINTQSKNTIRDVEFTLRCKDGSFLESSFTTRIGRDVAGGFIRTHSAFQDITAHKESEKAILLMAETQRQISGLKSIKEVYELVGSRIQALIGDGYVGISHLDEPSQAMQVVGLYGFGSLYDSLVKKFKFDPNQTTFPIKDIPAEDLDQFRSSRLEKFEDGIYRLALKKIPKRICGIVEKELKLSGVYTMGFVWEGIHHGGLSILAKSDLAPFKELIEATVNQATLAIQRILFEEDLRASEAQYRTLVNEVNDGFYISNLFGQLTFANRALAGILGFEQPQDLMGRNFLEFVLPAKSSDLEQQYQAAMSTGGPSQVISTEVVRQDGTRRFIEIKPQVIIEAGKVVGYRGTVSDITERRQDDEALQESELRYRERANELQTIMDTLPVALWIAHDPKCQVITGNRAAYELHRIPVGYNASLTSPESPQLPHVKIYHNGVELSPNDLPIQISAANGTEIRDFEEKIVFNDGTIVYELGNISPLFDETGQPRGAVGAFINITALKQSEHELQESHSLLEATLESTADGILVVDLHGRISLTNSKFAELWGIPQAVLDTHDDSAALNYVLEKLKEPQVFIGKVKELYAAPAAVSFDELEFKDGRIFERVSRPQYQGEAIVGRVWSFRDVTERKRAEEALGASEERFKQVAENAGEWIWEVDLQGLYTYSSPLVEKKLGYSLEEIVGKKHFYDFFAPDVRTSLKEAAFAALGRKESFKGFVNPNIHKDGHIVILETNGTPVFDSSGNLMGYRGADIDITERIQTEKHILESEFKYRSLFDNVLDGVYRTTLDGQILAANQAMVNMLGYTSEADLMKESSRQIYANKQGRKLFLDEMDKYGVVQNLEIQMRNKQGRTLVVLENSRSVRSENGEVLYFEGTLTDITQRKQGEIERQVLLEVMQGLAVTDDLKEYLKLVHQVISKMMYAENFFIMLKNKDTGLFEAVYFMDKYDLPPSPAVLDKSLSAYVFRSGQPLLSNQDSFDKLILQGKVELVGSNSPSWLGVPLIAFNETIGVMVVQDYETEDRYSEHDLGILNSIAGQVALAVKRKAAESELAVLYKAEQRRSHRLFELQSLSAELTGLHTERELLDTLVRRAASISNSPVATVMFLDEATNEIILVAQTGLPANTPTDLKIPLEFLPEAAQAFQSGDSIIVSDIDRDMPALRKVLVHPGIQAFFAFPLTLDGRVAGVITLSSLKPRHPSEAEINAYQLLARLASAALDNVHLFEGINRSLTRMGSLRRVDMAISASFDLILTLNILLEQVTTHLEVDAADILVFDQADSSLKYTCGRGFRSQALKFTNLRVGEGYAGRAALERRTIHVPDLQKDPSGLEKSTSLASEGFVSYWGVPLMAKGHIQGVLEVFNRQPIPVDQEWLDFLETLAGQAAIAIDNVLLFNHLERSNADLSMAYDSTLAGWATALELRDNETEGHTRRVAAITMQLAARMGVRDQEIMYLRWGSLLHDIGKMGVPDSILLKPGSLSEDEWAVMRKHPVLAYEMLAPIGYLRNALDIPYCHHEKWDGSGYPRGLKGEQIPLSARIFAIVDVWDALTSDRPYREAWTAEKALKYIQEQEGSHFDPQVVKTFLAMIGPDYLLPGG